MRWLLQNNIYSEDGWETLVSALKRTESDYSVHTVIPFSNGELTPSPELPDGANAIVMGSYTMARYAAARSWVPGAFLDGLDFELQLKHWGGRMLNYDAQVYKFGDIPQFIGHRFVRPVHDSKAWTGLVVDWPMLKEWQDNMRRLPDSIDPVNDQLGINLHTLDTPAMVCSTKEIYSEWRTWVIPKSVDKFNGSSVVTSSQYKIGSRKAYSPPEITDSRVINFANECVDIWHPNEAFVLDVADTSDGLKIVEINNLNSAGFYQGDIVKLAYELELSFGRP